MGEVLDAATHPQPSGRLFTVGIPVFNGKSLLRNCLQSVINSTLPRDRFEIVIADDGSSEPETLAILGEFEKSLAADPGFFRVISLGSNSGGAARPRNRILDEATGEYVFFVDSDDTIGNLALERIAEAVAVTPADWIALNQAPVNGRATVARVREPHAEVPRVQALATLTVHKVFRRAEIERQQLRFDEGLPPEKMCASPSRTSRTRRGSSCSADTTTTTSRSTATTRTNPPTSQGAPTRRRPASRGTRGSCARCSRPCTPATFPNPNGGRSSPASFCPGS